MANARALNKGYKPFSNEVYGETSFDQIENILNELPLSESVREFQAIELCSN